VRGKGEGKNKYTGGGEEKDKTFPQKKMKKIALVKEKRGRWKTGVGDESLGWH